MPKLFKVLGWLLIVPAVLFVVLIPVALAQGETQAIAGLIMFGAVLGVPGGLLLRGGIQREREAELQAQLVGFVRSHDTFSVAELGAHLGKTPAEAQLLLTRDIARYQLPLVMHRASGRYLRLDRLSQSAQVAEQCQSCGGSLGTQVVFAGERLTCPYCASPVQTHAPVPQAHWQPQPHAHQHGQPYGGYS